MDKWRGLSRTAQNPEPLAIELASLKDFLGIEPADTSSDALLSYLARSSQSFLRHLLGIEFINSTYVVTYDCVPQKSDVWWDGVREGAISDLYSEQRYLECPASPLVSITSINFYGTDGTPNLVDTSIYFAETQSNPGRAVLNFGKVWPTIILRPAAGIEITFVAGYGTTASDVPFDLQQAVIAMTAYLFEHRGTCEVSDAYRKSGAQSMTGAYSRRRPTL